MNKKQMSESDICMKFITPSIEKAKWDLTKQVRREVYFTEGKIIVAGKTVKRGKRKFVDYILEYKPNIPVAIVEAKKNVLNYKMDNEELLPQKCCIFQFHHSKSNCIHTQTENRKKEE